MQVRVRLRLGAVLRQQGIKETELARRANISPNTARALARRGGQRRIDLNVLEAIARVLDVRPMELLEEYEIEEIEEERLTPALAMA
jgi:DNA-binding Xre family transcriptional regulator